MSQSPAIDHLLLSEKSSEAILGATDTGRKQQITLPQLDWRLVLGALFVVGGLAAAFAGWWGASGTGSTKDQLSYIASGGVGGAVLIALGVMFMVAYEHTQDRAALTDLTVRMVALEDAMADQFDQLHQILSERNGLGRSKLSS